MSKSAQPKVSKLVRLSLSQYNALERIKTDRGLSHNSVIMRGIELAIKEITPEVKPMRDVVTV